MVAFPAVPVDAVSVRGVIASQVAPVEVGVVTTAVPPGAFVFLCTGAWECIVVLVRSTELPSRMPSQRITFRQQVIP